MISINLFVHISCGKLDIEIVEVRDNVLANEQLYLIYMGLNIHRQSTDISSQIQTKYIYHGKQLHLRAAKIYDKNLSLDDYFRAVPSNTAARHLNR